ncbi:hypothetical protein LRP88_12535 [Fusarium phalaenopsidis]
MPAPSIAIFGPHGFIGKEIVPTSALRHLLGGVDVVISCMGTKGNYKENRKVLVEACAKAKVKVYIPSEWGTDHNNIKYDHPMFISKQEHHAYAEQLGLKTVAIYTGLIMETSFCKWFGFDTKNRTWNIVGTGDKPVAMTSQRDLGPLTLQTVLLAFSTPEKCPSYLRIVSDNRFIKDYQRIFESESKQKLKVIRTSLEDAERDYEHNKASIPSNMLGPLMNLLVANGSFDHTANAREIINPGQQYFQWKTVDDYAKEVHGLPWENASPW